MLKDIILSIKQRAKIENIAKIYMYIDEPIIM